MKLIILQGLPASGKTTYAKKWVAEKPKERIRVCRDDIRRMLGPYWIPSRESLVTEIENFTIEKGLKSNRSVIVDATNFKIKRFVDLIQNYKDVELELKFLNTSLEECLKRDRVRQYSVGDDIIINFYNKYINNI